MRARSWLRPGARPGRKLLLTLLIFALGVAAGFLAHGSLRGAQDPPAADESDDAFQPFREAVAIIESRYLEPVTREQLVDGAIAGLVAALDDPHSGYIRPGFCEAAADFSGEFSGIGVMVATDDVTGAIAVASVIPDSPAHTAGVLAGDIFHSVDALNVVGFTEAELSALVPGARGTTVTITFQRGAEFVTFELMRDVFALPNVSQRMVSDDIALIEMKDFNDLSRAQLDEALAALNIDEASGLIFDIRGNPGGTLASAIEIGSAFIADGILLRQVQRDESEEATRASGGYANIKAPIVVLVDETSASAAEVIAGAMQDHGAATILGERTFGKGTVQNLPELSNGGCLRITIKRWLTPAGHWIHDQGIQPDIIVEWDPTADASPDDDPQLQAAIKLLESKRD